MRDYMDRRVNLPKGATSPTWGPPPPCKQALTVLHVDSNPLNGADVLTHLRSFLSFFFYQTQPVGCLSHRKSNIRNKNKS